MPRLPGPPQEVAWHEWQCRGSTNLVVETDYTYDGIGRLTDLTHAHDTTTIADYAWTYDAFSRVTQLDFTSSVGNDGTSDYTYDDTGQLTAVDHDFQTDESYSYDENGNRTNTGYTTGTNNQMTSDGTFNYTYDDEGNRESRTRISTDPADDKTTEYTWDHDNRLTRIVYKNNSGTSTKQIDYTYDLFGRRIFKEVDADGAGAGSSVTTEYVYDGEDILLALDSDGDITNRYLHGPAVDQALADEQVGDEVLWPLADDLGSVRDIIDSDGNVENHITYDAYGNVTSETASSVDHIFGFTGRERDEESDLQFNRARYYDANVGRWISEDPVGFAAGDSNLSRYVGNAPTNFIDPSGLVEIPMEEASEPETLAVASDALLRPFATQFGKGSARIAKSVKRYWDFFNEPIPRPVPRCADGTTSLPWPGGQHMRQRFEAGDPEYTTTVAEEVFELYITVLDTAIVVGTLGGGSVPRTVRGATAGRLPPYVSRWPKKPIIKPHAPKGPSLRGDTILSGGRSGQNVKNLVGPPNSAVRGGGDRIFITNDKGQVILDMTRGRVKPVTPGQGFGPKRPPTPDELSLLNQLLGGGS